MGQQEGLKRRDVLAGLLGTAALACTDAGGIAGIDTANWETGTSVLDTGKLSGVDWLTGGTASLGTAYDVDAASGCLQLCELTLGPCYAETLDRQDISEGVEGLPTRMVLRIVDTDCNPLPGVVVDVWHCAPSGLYSGSDAQDMCTDRDTAARASRWFRGLQTTDADGMATFDTCLPGWYSGRAVHIHFQVRVDGQAYVTSQLGFEQSLLSDVYGSHPDYVARGEPDTPNQRDNILASSLDTNLFEWRQADDGALVVWKTIAIRGSLSEPTC